jgi:hypothetical protein
MTRVARGEDSVKANLLNALKVALVVTVLLGGIGMTRADVPVAPEISGTVQDWRPESGYMVVDGVRYRFGEDFVLRSDRGPGLPLESLRVGDRVRFASYDGVVEVVTLVTESTRQ